MDDRYKLTLSEYEIYSLLSQLGVKHEKEVNSKGWIKCRCLNPSHIDHNPSCSINIYTYKVKCLSCKYDTNLTSAVAKILSISYKDAFEYIIKKFDYPPSSFTLKQNIKSNSPIVEKKQEVHKDYITIDLLPDNFRYTVERGFNQNFIDKFNIRHCLSDIYSDYMMIPIIDEEFNVNTYEFRKLKQYEILEKFGIADWKKYKEENELTYKKGQVQSKDGQIFNQDIIYLMKPKVLYIKNTNIQNTIFNHKNLNYSQPLNISEGSGSLPKMMKVFGNNCSCLYGTELSENQIKILQRFEEINILSDNDMASFYFINNLSEYHNNVNVFNIKIDDTNIDFEKTLSSCSLLKSREFLLKFI